MKIIDLTDGTEISSVTFPLACAIGNFDGVHLGHRQLIKSAADFCRKSNTNIKCAVFTFESNTSGAPFLVLPEQKLRLAGECGAQVAVTVPFDEVKGMSCEAFVSDILVGRLNVERAFCGFNFRFGSMGAGNGAILSSLMEKYGRSAEILPPVTFDGAPVSSTRIRAALAEGNIAAANAMLCSKYGFTSEVLHGKALGATLGFPTANQSLPAHFAMPRRGVYASLCDVDGRIFPAVSNIGVRPSVESDGRENCETNIIGFSGDLYGRTISVYPMIFLRPEQKFGSTGELAAAVLRDRETAKRLLSRCESI